MCAHAEACNVLLSFIFRVTLLESTFFLDFGQFCLLFDKVRYSKMGQRSVARPEKDYLESILPLEIYMQFSFQFTTNSELFWHSYSVNDFPRCAPSANF